MTTRVVSISASGRVLPVILAGVLFLLAPLSDAQVRLRDVLSPRTASLRASILAPVRHDLYITVGEDSLDATVYIPSDAPADSAGYPGILFVHGFGESKDADTLDARFWAGSGYIALCYSVRGQGNSSGGTTIMGTAERADLALVVSFMRSIPGIDTARIGVQGSSQGGAHVLWAVADSLPIAAGVADVIIPRWASDMLANGSVRTTLSFLLRTEGVRYDPVRDTLWHYLRDDDYESLWNLFVPTHDIDTAQLHRSRIPLVTFVKWQDHYFSAEDGLESYLRQTGPRKIYAGTGGHYSDNVQSELEYQWEIIGAWMEEFIGGGVSGVLARPPVTFAYSSLPIQSGNVFTWTHEELALWPPPGIRPVALYLNQDSTLSPERPAQENGILNVRNNWSGTYPLDSGFVDGFHGERFDQNLPRESVAFMSAPLGGDCFWIGAPTMHLHIGSYYSRFPLHAQVFEVDQAGSKHFINRIPFTARGWVPGSIERADVRGLAHAHLFRKGNRIRLELSNIDGEARFLWGDVPFTVPMFAVASAALFMDEQRPSWIELPMLGDPSLPNSIGILAADADARTGTVRLSWQTPAERNNAGFVVERSGTSATGFVAIATLPPAAGPVSAGPTRYECLDTNRQIGRWYYRVRQIDEDGTGHLSQVITVDVLTAVSGGTEPLAFVLEQNSPNPFNPSTAISYQVPRGGPVRLAVFDILGREVALLVNGPQPPGRYSVRFDGSRFSSGVYLCRLEAGGSAAVRRMLLLK